MSKISLIITILFWAHRSQSCFGLVFNFNWFGIQKPIEVVVVIFEELHGPFFGGGFSVGHFCVSHELLFWGFLIDFLDIFITLVHFFENLLLKLSILIENSTHFIKDSTFNLNCILLRFTLLNSIIFISIIGQSLLKFDHLFIKVLFNISVILKEFLVDVSVGGGHLALVVLDHFFELVTELTICFVESDLDSVLKRRFINSHFIFKILKTLGESCFYNFQFFSH